MSVSNTITLSSSSYNQLNSRQLATNLQCLSFAAFSVQAYALLVQRQQSVPTITGLDIDVAATQDALRARAAYLMQSILPLSLTALTDADGAANLIEALKTQVTQLLASDNPDQPGDIAQLARATAGRLAELEQNAQDAASSWAAEADAVAKIVAAQRAAVEAAIETIDGPDGLLVKTDAAITVACNNIAADIDSAVKSGKEIGDGVKSLITGVFSSLSGVFSSDDKDENAKGTENEGNEAKPSSKTPPKPVKAKSVSDKGDNTPPVSLEGLAAIEQGIGNAGRVLPNFKRDYAQLAVLYQQLATTNAGLAVLRAVESQGALLANAVGAASTAAQNVTRAWNGITDGFDDAADQLANSDDDGTVNQFSAALTSAVALGWGRLSPQLAAFEQAFAGLASAIPPGGNLTSNN